MGLRSHIRADILLVKAKIVAEPLPGHYFVRQAKDYSSPCTFRSLMISPFLIS